MNASQQGEALARGYARVQAFAKQHQITDINVAASLLHQQDTQTAAEREVLAFAAQLTPQEIQYLQRLDSTGGSDSLFAALVQSGRLSRPALEMVAQTYVEAGGLAGVAERISGRMQEQAEIDQQAAIRESVSRAGAQKDDSPIAAQVKAKSPLAGMLQDPEVQKAAAALFKEKGWTVAKGQTPLGSLLNLARDLKGGDFMNESRSIGEKKWTAKEAIGELAALMGDTPDALEALLHEVDVADHHHDLHTRLAKRDTAKPRIGMDGHAFLRMRSEQARRSKLEEVYDQIDQKRATPQPATGKPRVATEAASTRKPAPELRREALDREYDRIERGEEAEPVTIETTNPRRAALEGGYEQINEEEAA